MDRYWDTISSIEARVLVVGPTALRTIYGAVVSIYRLQQEKVYGWCRGFAARGGDGSVLA